MIKNKNSESSNRLDKGISESSNRLDKKNSESNRYMGHNSALDSYKDLSRKDNINSFVMKIRKNKNSLLQKFNDEILIKDIGNFFTELEKILQFIESYSGENIEDMVRYFYDYNELPEDIDILNFLRIELCIILKLKMSSSNSLSIKYTMMNNLILEKINKKLKEMTEDKIKNINVDMKNINKYKILNP